MTAKILVVDDSITIQKIVAMAFENEDASVEGIGNGDEGLARLDSFRPDIVLADVDMPGLNGFELSREIKGSSKFNTIPVLLLASDFEEFDENLFRGSLADDHITKPFKSEDLVQKVTDLLNGHAQAAETGEDEEIEEMIELSSSHRLDEDEEPEEVIELASTDRLVEDEETEDVIELSSSHRLDEEEEPEEVIELSSPDPLEEDFVLELDEDHLMDSEVSSLEPTEALDPPDDHAPLVLGDKEDQGQEEIVQGVAQETDVPDPHPEDNPQMAVTGDDQEETESTDPEESLDELLRKVAELSRKSEELSNKGPRDELSPMEAIDVMLKEVSALKDESLGVAPEDENSCQESPESESSSGPHEKETVLAEVDYVSEENAEALEVAFDDITNGKKIPSPVTAQEPSERQEADSQGAESRNALSELQSLKEGPLARLMETEVRRMIQETLTSLIEKELSGLSEKIIRIVEDNVREITPGIAQAIIEKEIDKIKTMEDG